MTIEDKFNFWARFLALGYAEPSSPFFDTVITNVERRVAELRTELLAQRVTA